ncbi:MAG: hypothetical protein JRJ00_13650 [Deltaproteobacteria bacterium]|nr:hypothetical protein [Deltaproteobacteria bacterium]
MFNPTTVWFVLGLILALSEFAVPGVILIFFGVGAWIVAATTYLTFNTPNYIFRLILGNGF